MAIKKRTGAGNTKPVPWFLTLLVAAIEAVGTCLGSGWATGTSTSSGTCSGLGGCIDKDLFGVCFWLIFDSLVGWTTIKMRKKFFQSTPSNRNSIWVLKNYLNFLYLVSNSRKLLIICILNIWQCRCHSGRRCHWFPISCWHSTCSWRKPGQIFLIAYVSRHQSSCEQGDISIWCRTLAWLCATALLFFPPYPTSAFFQGHNITTLFKGLHMLLWGSFVLTYGRIGYFFIANVINKPTRDNFPASTWITDHDIFQTGASSILAHQFHY